MRKFHYTVKWITDKQRAENIYNPSKTPDQLENNLPNFIYNINV